MKRGTFIVLKNIAIVLLFSTILISSSISFAVDCNLQKTAVNMIPEDIYQWADGYFDAELINTNESIIGSIHGYIQQGRNPSIGQFIGWIMASDGSFIGNIQGFFIRNFIIGSITDSNLQKSSYFFGKFSYDDLSFTADIKTSVFGDVQCIGTHVDSFMPMLTGPYNVGVESIHLIDYSRYEEFTPDDPNDYREMMVQLWYPVENDFIGDRIDYMDQPTFEWLWGRSPVQLITIPDDAYEFVRPYSIDNLPISNDESMFPVIIFSHGYDGVYQIYTSLIEDIVSHGFIVASINHPFIAGITVFPDGRTIGVSRESTGNLGIRSIVDDSKFVLDILTDMNSNDDKYKGHLDLSNVGMYGHSFGGAATTICCFEDSRFKAGLTLDGVVYTDYITGEIDKPILMMYAESRFSNDTIDQYFWEKCVNDAYQITVKGSSHYGYTDIGILLDHFVPLIPAEPLGFGSINAKRLVNITKSFEIAFFEAYLKNMSNEPIFELSNLFDEVIFNYKD